VFSIFAQITLSMAKSIRNNKPKHEGGKHDSVQKIEKPQKKSKSFDLNQWLSAIFLGIVAFLLYANTLSHGWALDDYSVIKDNYITQQGTKGISTLMSTEYRFGYWNSSGSLYRPLSLVMFAIEWQYFPDNPFIGHFMNVLLYALTAIALFFTLSKMLKSYSLALPFIITLLYVAHPMHVEVVANIKSRDEILAMLFSIIALNYVLQYLDTEKIIALITALLAYAIALFSKESSITFLAVFPLAVYFFREIAIAKNLKTTALMLIPAILFLIVRQKVLGEQTMLEAISPLDNTIVQNGVPKLAGALAMMLIYFKNMFFPLHLVSDLGYNAIPLSGWGDAKTLGALILNIALLVYAYIGFKKKDPIAFGILFFYITFSISSNIFITIGTSYGERLVYAASLGLLFSMVFIAYKWLKTSSNLDENIISYLGKSPTFASLFGLLFLFYSFKTIARNPAWKDSFSLYETDIQQYTEGAKLNYHYALELTKKGRDNQDPALKKQFFDKAIFHFNKALSISPNYKDAYGEMGLAYFYAGDSNKAMENYQKAIAIQPDAKIYSNMGMIYFQLQNLTEAQKVYEKSLQIDPRYVDGMRNLGSCLAMQGKFKEAIPYFKKAIEYKPNEAILYFFLGSAYRDSGDAATGQQYLNKAQQMGLKR
jgi:protein O-mannosyl-transferase